jgi:hypothetical protein
LGHPKQRPHFTKLAAARDAVLILLMAFAQVAIAAAARACLVHAALVGMRSTSAPRAFSAAQVNLCVAFGAYSVLHPQLT